MSWYSVLRAWNLNAFNLQTKRLPVQVSPGYTLGQATTITGRTVHAKVCNAIYHETIDNGGRGKDLEKRDKNNIQRRM